MRFPVLDIGRTVLALGEDYVAATLPEKRRLHNDLVLVLNTARAAM